MCMGNKQRLLILFKSDLLSGAPSVFEIILALRENLQNVQAFLLQNFKGHRCMKRSCADWLLERYTKNTEKRCCHSFISCNDLSLQFSRRMSQNRHGDTGKILNGQY